MSAPASAPPPIIPDAEAVIAQFAVRWPGFALEVDLRLPGRG
jgi:hypothetical protein